MPALRKDAKARRKYGKCNAETRSGTQREDHIKFLRVLLRVSAPLRYILFVFFASWGPGVRSSSSTAPVANGFQLVNYAGNVVQIRCLGESARKDTHVRHIARGDENGELQSTIQKKPAEADGIRGFYLPRRGSRVAD